MINNNNNNMSIVCGEHYLIVFTRNIQETNVIKFI